MVDLRTSSDPSIGAEDIAPRVSELESPTLPPGEHLGFLDGARALAAVYVTLHHAMITLPELSTPAERVLGRVFELGHGAVDVFIVLSGYCLMLPLLRTPTQLDFWTFIQRRALRIVPTYYCAMGISLLLIATLIGEPTGAHWDASLPVTERDVLLHLALVHDWSVTSAARINHVFWSIGVEWKIYFLFPALLMLRRVWGTRAMTFAAIFAGYALWAVLHELRLFNPSPWGSSPYYIGLFALGMCAAELGTAARRGAWRPSRWWRTALLCGIPLLLGLSFWRAADGRLRIPLQLMSLPIGAWAAAMLASLHAGAFPRLGRVLSLPGVTSVGRIGYSVYLIHAPILQIVYQYVLVRSSLLSSIRPFAMLTLGLGATLLAAYPFYRFAEQPFHRLSRRVRTRLAKPLSPHSFG